MDDRRTRLKMTIYPRDFVVNRLLANHDFI